MELSKDLPFDSREADVHFYRVRDLSIIIKIDFSYNPSKVLCIMPMH